MNIILRNSSRTFQYTYQSLCSKQFQFFSNNQSQLHESDSSGKSVYETYEQKKNLVLVEDKFTDFQNTFGFREDLEELKKQNEQKEKRKYASYSLGALIGIGVITGVLLVGIDPALDNSLKRAIYVHSCNLKLKKQNILNTRTSSKKKLQIIEEYLQKMKVQKVRQPAYNLILVDELKAIIYRHSLLNETEMVQQCLQLLAEIQLVMISSEKYRVYHEEYFRHIENIAFCLIQNNINLLDGASFQVICEFCFLKTTDSKIMNTMIKYLIQNKFNLNEQSSQVTDEFINKSIEVIHNYNTSPEDEYKYKAQKDFKYVDFDGFIKFNNEYQRQYLKSTIFQMIKLIAELEKTKKQQYQKQIEEINQFISSSK